MIRMSSEGALLFDGKRRIRKIAGGYRADRLLSSTHQVCAVLPTLAKAKEWLDG